MSEQYAAADRVRLKRQRDVLREVMESAGMCEVWLTLGEIAERTGYSTASISAQLRHLRNGTGGYDGPRYEVKKRRRAGGLWEYMAWKIEAAKVTKKVEQLAKGRVRVTYKAEQLELRMEGKA